jgi:hypothetical protein
MGMPAEDGVAAALVGTSGGAGSDLARAANKCLGAFFGETGDVVRAIDLLEEPVGGIGNPGEKGVVGDEVIKLVAVDDEDFAGAGAEDEFLDDGNAEKVGDNVRGAVVVAGDPDEIEFVGEVADEGEHFPVRFFQAPEVDGVKDIAVDDETAGFYFAIEDGLEESSGGLGLAVVGAEMNVGDDDGIKEVGVVEDGEGGGIERNGEVEADGLVTRLIGGGQSRGIKGDVESGHGTSWCLIEGMSRWSIG